MNRITYQWRGRERLSQQTTEVIFCKPVLMVLYGAATLQKSRIQIIRLWEFLPPQTSKCVWKAAETADTLSLQAGSIQLDIGLSSGHFLWRDAATGKELLQEGNKELTSVPVVKYSTGGEAPKIRRVKTVDGERNFIENLKPYTDREAYRGKIFFQWRHDEQLHGLGQPKRGSIITAAKPSIFTSII